jgi:hypothetical protein
MSSAGFCVANGMFPISANREGASKAKYQVMPSRGIARVRFCVCLYQHDISRLELLLFPGALVIRVCAVIQLCAARLQQTISSDMGSNARTASIQCVDAISREDIMDIIEFIGISFVGLLPLFRKSGPLREPKSD